MPSDWDARYHANEQLLLNSRRVPPRNKRLILKFVEELQGLGNLRGNKIKRVTAASHLMLHRTWAEMFASEHGPVGSPSFPRNPTRSSLNRLRKKWSAVGDRIEARELSEATKNDLRARMKQFICWHYGRDYNPIDWKWLRTTIPRNRRRILTTAELILAEEVPELLRATVDSQHPFGHERNMFLVALNFHCALRPKEIAGLRRGDVREEDGDLVVYVHNAKTEKKRLVIEPIRAYWEAYEPLHAFADHAPLFLASRTRFEGGSGEPALEGLSQAAINKIYKALVRRAGFEGKRTTIYSFRHGRATDLHRDPAVSDAQIKQIMGHVKGSRAAGQYDHLVDEDTDAAMGGNGKPRVLWRNIELAKRCYLCESETANPITYRECRRCGFPLDEQLVKDVEQMAEQKIGDEKRETDAELLRLKARLIDVESVREELDLLKKWVINQGRRGSQRGGRSVTPEEVTAKRSETGEVMLEVTKSRERKGDARGRAARP